MKGIKYVASFKDYSGYAAAARKNVAAIRRHGIHVRGRNVSFAANESLIEKAELAEIDAILAENNINYDVVFQHLTPENWPAFKERGMFNAGHTVWEADRLHPSWIPPCNDMNLVLVPCRWNVEVFKHSGIKTPVEIYPHAFDTTMFDNVPDHPMFVQYHHKLKFYSIFQWSERKNPAGLIRSFCSAFSSSDDVVLFIKTYAGNGMAADTQWLMGEIQRIVNSINKSDKPEIVLLSNLTTEEKIRQLHKGCDVYLAPVRGEGFGIPIFEAALAGNQVIATNYGGHTDFLDKHIHHLVPFSMTPIVGMVHIKWYLADMFWAEPDLSFFVDKMRTVYRHWRENGAVEKEDRRADHAEKLTHRYSYRTVTNDLIATLRRYL